MKWTLGVCRDIKGLGLIEKSYELHNLARYMEVPTIGMNSPMLRINKPAAWVQELSAYNSGLGLVAFERVDLGSTLHREDLDSRDPSHACADTVVGTVRLKQIQGHETRLTYTPCCNWACRQPAKPTIRNSQGQALIWEGHCLLGKAGLRIAQFCTTTGPQESESRLKVVSEENSSLVTTSSLKDT